MLKNQKGSIEIILVIIVLIAVVGIGAFVFTQSSDDTATEEQASSNSELVSEDTADTTDASSELIELGDSFSVPFSETAEINGTILKVTVDSFDQDWVSERPDVATADGTTSSSVELTVENISDETIELYGTKFTLASEDGSFSSTSPQPRSFTTDDETLLFAELAPGESKQGRFVYLDIPETEQDLVLEFNYSFKESPARFKLK